MKRERVLIATLAIGAALTWLFVQGNVSRAAPTVDIYTGDSVISAGIKLRGWGSGTGKEDRQKSYNGDRSIHVTTNGYYAGARMQFERPVDLTEQTQDPFSLLEFLIFFKEGPEPRNRQQGGVGGLGSPGSQGAGPQGSSGAGPQGPGSGSGAAGLPGFPGGVGGLGGGSGRAGQQRRPPATRRLKVILVGEEGRVTATNQPVVLFPARQENWFEVAVPFSAFKGLDKMDSFNLREIRLFGDHKDDFWIGEIRTATDEEPITVEPLSAQEVSVGDQVQFRAEATAGLSALKFSWDFDASDGIQEDATGPVVVHYYRKPSELLQGSQEPEPYVVTLTVSDLSGVKKPERRQTDVVVNP